MDVLYRLSYIGEEDYSQSFSYCPDASERFGAEDRARTGHPQLGRLMLYQMSYFRLLVKEHLEV